MHRGLTCASSSSRLATSAQSAGTSIPRRYRSAKASRLRETPAAQAVSDWTGHLINHASQGESAQGFKHTSGRRAAEQRLQAAIEKASKQRTSSLLLSADKQRFQTEKTSFEGLSTLDDEDLSSPVAPGTFVELRRNGINTLAVALQDVVLNNRAVTLGLTIEGDLWPFRRQDAFFAVPGFVSANLAARCGIRVSSTTPQENSARVEVLRRIRDIGVASERLVNALSPQFTDLYARVRHEDPDKWADIGVTEAAEMLTAKTNSPLLKLFAVYKLLMAHPIEFVASQESLEGALPRFSVRPHAHIQRLHALHDVIRRKDRIVDDFAAKAKDAIFAFRERATDSWDEPPTVQPSNITYDPKYHFIIQVLQESLRDIRSIQDDPYAIPVAAVLRKIGLYPEDLIDGSTIHRALIELGVINPWQDMRQLALGVEENTERIAEQEKADAAIVKRGLSRQPSADIVSPLGPEDLLTHDPLDAQRHDFGDLPAYVIDDVGAQELDDSVSLERIPSEPESLWLHVHIADPTSVLPPGHVFAKRAREQATTYYWANRTVPMIPFSLVHQGLSLGSMAKEGKPQRVLSFSMKIDAEGIIVDYRVRAGLLRNLHVVKYDEVDAILGAPSFPVLKPFGVSAGETAAAAAQLPEEHVDNLRALYDATRRLVSARLRLPTFMWSYPRVAMQFASGPAPSPPPHGAWPSIARGFPKLEYGVQQPEQPETGSRSLVAECMKAANRAASRFCRDRGLPMLRRASPQILTFTDEDFAAILATRDARGQADAWTVVRSGATNPVTSFTTATAMHWALGIPAGEGYTWVTSPLRRFPDLLAHWQIKHALLDPAGRPLYSEEELTELAGEMHNKLRNMGKRGREHSAAWAMRYVDRVINGAGRATADPRHMRLLENLDAYPIGPAGKMNIAGMSSAKAVIPKLGLDATLMFENEFLENVQLGVPLPVRIERIKHGMSSQMAVVPRK